MSARPVTILLCALGGEGGGVLSQWLVNAAQLAGFPAQSTSIPGVAQRTGATTYYVEVLPQRIDAGGPRPVFCLNPMPGEIDLIVSSELLETGRQIAAGLSDPSRTTIITSSARALTTIERMQLGDGRYDDDALAAAIREFSRAHHVLDMAAMTHEAGTIVSAVMLGAIAASGVLPIDRATFEAAIGGGTGAEASRRGFAMAFDALTNARRQTAIVAEVANEVVGRLASDAAIANVAPSLPETIACRFPAAAHGVIALGLARVTEYQDADYGQLYLERLAQVYAAEQAADPAGKRGWRTTTEAARWLALWMAFDDIVRVADLKARASRRARVIRETKARDGDVVKLYDHFKPGVPEFAGLLPAGLARRLEAWDARRQSRGHAPWSFKLVLGTHTVFGLAALRVLASCKGMRRRGRRFAEEQRDITLWLGTIAELTAADWRAGHEAALCGRLIKGYGSTNERGRRNLLHIVDQLARRTTFVSPAARADALAAARNAALADEAGTTFDKTLAAHGAAPRDIKPQPIRFVRRRAQNAPA